MSHANLVSVDHLIMYAKLFRNTITNGKSQTLLSDFFFGERAAVHRLYVRTVDDAMAIKPRFLASMGYHIFLTMVLRAREPSARAKLL